VTRHFQAVARRIVVTLREDRLYRTSILLIGDNLALGMLGGLFIVIATHVWDPRSIGIVSAIYGATGIIETVAILGMPATIVANLASEPDQALMVRGALCISLPVAIVLLALLWLLPNHIGVPLAELGVNTPVAVALTMAVVVGGLVAAIVDPAFLARQEVSWIAGKDLIATITRFIALGVLAGTRTAGYLAVAAIYISSAAIGDLVLLRWRLKRGPRIRISLGVGLVRSHASFAAGSQIAVLVSALPTSLLPLIILSRLGPAAVAYATIPLTIIGVLCVFPTMAAQSLFAEIASHPGEFVEPIRKSLKAAYAVTLPVAVVVLAIAPKILDLFGNRYSLHGSDLLRWGAASSIFFCLNFISDIVLLARKFVAAYVTANVIGAACVLISLVISVRHGLGGLGVGWFIGQACYCAVSCMVLAWHVGRRNLLSVLSDVWR